jgi:4a-hydroxytetrahydrobiopterin dehydratase
VFSADNPSARDSIVSPSWQNRIVETLNNQRILNAGLADWRKLAQALHAPYLIPSYVAASTFFADVAHVVGTESHHLDVRLTGGCIDLSLCTHEDGPWVTQKDIDLARQISEVAREQGLISQPNAVTQLEVALDTAHEDSLGPFWSALLTGSPDNRIYDSVFDPTSRVPALWFQGTGDHDTPRQRWHFDLWRDPEVADERIAVAVASGGSVVDASAAPSFTVLADPDGNRVCICTAIGR